MKYILSLYLIFVLGSVSGQSLQQRIENAFNAFESDPQMSFATASLTVLNAASGEVIFSRNGSKGLAPASTLKTVTAAAAYHLLGRDFTWDTTLGYTGSIAPNGVLNGDIIISGSGDPSLGSERYDQTQSHKMLQRWADAIKRAGISKVAGRVIADDSLFGTQTLPGGWTWQDIGNYYGAGPSTLTWRENQFDLIFMPGKVGNPAQLLRTEPDMRYLKIVNEVSTGRPGTGDNVYAYSAPYSNVVYVRGTYGVDLKKNISASVPDPAFDLASNLLDKLKASGIFADGATTARELEKEKVPFSKADKVLDTYTSPALDKIVYWFNQKSINLYGEHLIKTIAWKQNKDISTAEGVDVVNDFWNKKLGIDRNAINTYDGSGLSPSNRITTMAMTQILQSVKRESWFGSFFESLPVYNNMKMKSGSIADVIAYTGYHTSTNGTPLVFSFILNNYSGSGSTARQKLFKVLDSLK
jgi:D-alanyl-D-alanine carboxypeptidase/D-alanyl-D-alanine-endopeptidase (penicillin-binding protein 4)